MAELWLALSQGAEAMGVALTATQLRQLLDYLTLLQQWGRVYNLTAVRQPAKMVVQHLLDSLAVANPLRRHLAKAGTEVASRILDVGSGAGLPGVVLSVCCPAFQVHCIDAVAKKAAFVRQVGARLSLGNLHALHGRVEHAGGRFDVVISRAFASLADFVRFTKPRLADGGVWLAMKGRIPAEEIAALSADIEVFHVEQLQVPGLDAQRCVVWMRPRAAN